MRKIKNMTRKQMIITAVSGVALILAIILTVLFLNVDRVNNENPELNSNIFGVLSFEYGAEISSDRFEIERNNDKVEIQVKNIDTMKLGKTEYTANALEGLKTIIVDITDTQNPIIQGENEFDVKFDKEFNLSEFLNSKLSASDPVDGKLELSFIHEDLVEPGDYEVKVSAKDKNGNTTVKEVLIKMTEDKLVNVDEPEPTKPEPVNPDKPVDNPEPTKPEPVNPDKPIAKPEPTKPDKPVVNPEPTKPDKPVVNPNTKVPSGLPAGSVLIEEYPNGDKEFSYSQALTGGSSVDKFLFEASSNDIGIIGQDESGDMFLIRITPSERTTLNYYMATPKLSDKARIELISLADSIWSAYGM